MLALVTKMKPSSCSPSTTRSCWEDWGMKWECQDQFYIGSHHTYLGVALVSQLTKQGLSQQIWCVESRLGSVLGHVLFLLYLIHLGKIIQRFSDVSYHIFADDIQLYCAFKSTELQRLNSLVHCLVEIKQWLSDNTLQLNVDKTETLVIAPDDSIPGLNQYLGDLGQSLKLSLRNLGVVLNKDMCNTAKQLTKYSFFQLRKISKLKKMV